MSIRATSPFPVYLDADGTPLTGGYVYFGTSGANPETTPQAVFWDEALSVPAAQPIRTINGFLMRNGSPASVYLANPYSILVRNTNLVLLYSSLTNAGASASAAMAPVVSAATLAAGLTAFGFSAFIQTLIDDASAAIARATLGAVGLTGAEAVAGVKTFSDGIVSAVTGNLTGTASEAAGVRETGAGAELLKFKVIEIGDWNMDSTDFVSVDTGVAHANWRSVTVYIKSDAGSAGNWPPLLTTDGGHWQWSAADGDTFMSLVRTTAGSFDNTAFDATGYNRGWITIGYVA